jgi:hypothetical protein
VDRNDSTAENQQQAFMDKWMGRRASTAQPPITGASRLRLPQISPHALHPRKPPLFYFKYFHTSNSSIKKEKDANDHRRPQRELSR